MARKSESGIEYFPMNSDIIHNKKVKLLVAEFGSKTTWAVLLPLYCKIYRENGYWIDWFDEDSKMLFAQDECKIEMSVLNEVVNGCIRRSFFDKRVFDLFGILTSDRIQENYLIAKKRTESVDFIDEFLVLPDKVFNKFKNVNIIDLNVNIIKKNVNASTQKKKEKKIIEGEEEKKNFHPPDLSKSNLFREPVIPTKHQVWESFIQNGGTKEMAKSFWDRNEATGWYFKGSPITNFRNMVASYVSNWKKNSKEEINTQHAGIARKLEEEQANAILDS